MITKKTIYGTETAYRVRGEGRDVVLMHGWGQNMDMMAAIEEHLSPYFRVFNLDFPGFGESGDPHQAWGMPEYVEFFRAFCVENSIENPILIAHSFGCRVAIRYAVLYPVYKMCLTGAAGIKPPLTAGQKLRTAVYKTGKKCLQLTGQNKLLKELQDQRGSADYRNARGVMRETFVKVVNDDLSPVLREVKCPVLLVWGDLDEAVPLWMGQKMEREMPDAGLAVFQGEDHFAYWHQPERFNAVLDIFLKEDMK